MDGKIMWSFSDVHKFLSKTNLLKEGYCIFFEFTNFFEEKEKEINCTDFNFCVSL